MTDPSYPQFTGQEACASIGFDFYWTERGAYARSERDTVRQACLACPLYRECLEWALHRERWGYWAGTTEKEREAIRRRRRIPFRDPIEIGFGGGGGRGSAA